MSGGPLDLAAAERLVGQHLGITPRAAHSRFVRLLLEALAAPEQRQLWRLVGLVHDLDYFAVGEDWSRHGRLTAEWLAGLLPPRHWQRLRHTITAAARAATPR